MRCAPASDRRRTSTRPRLCGSVPITQHDALQPCAQIVLRGAMGMAVNQRSRFGAMQPVAGSVGIDIGPHHVGTALVRLAAGADVACQRVPLGQRARQESLLPSSASHLTTEANKRTQVMIVSRRKK